VTAATWYCTRCGEVAPIKPLYLVFDPRYALVSHHGHDYPAISDPEAAQVIRSSVAATLARRRATLRQRQLREDDE
jgi:hypothetical protein